LWLAAVWNVDAQPLEETHYSFASPTANASYYWGTYRPQVYFGMRNRDAHHALWTGLMWQRLPHTPIRDQCADSGDLHYGWREHDGRTYGSQTITDTGARITTTYLRPVLTNAEADFSWANWIQSNTSLTLFYYMVVEHNDASISHRDTPTHRIFHVSDNGREAYFVLPRGKSRYWGFKLAQVSSRAYRVAESIFVHLQTKSPSLPNKMAPNTNMVVYQLMCSGACELPVLFYEDELPTRFGQTDSLATLAQAHSLQFRTRFEKTFPCPVARWRPALEYAFSNLVGGMGYFYGTSYRKTQQPPFVRQESAAELFTAVPSRSFFPRGFLWDEGFMQLLVGSWDPYLSFESIGSWLGRMDDDGWIAREQILGDEARSRVPQEFVPQDKTHVNPPTFLLWLDFMLDRAPESLMRPFLERYYEKFARHVAYLDKTQRSRNGRFFQWRGRTLDHLLASGLDDYPRSDELHEDMDRHLDLLCWMFMASRSLQRAAAYLDRESDAQMYARHMAQHRSDLDAFYWNATLGRYADWNSEHVGYVSLFPLIAGMLDPQSPKLASLLDLISSPQHLWTPYGLASLSKSDPLFGSKENYWRGSIWINFQYLVLRGLHRHYASRVPRAQQIYNELRSAVVENVARQFTQTGFIWEQYAPLDGRGLRSRPFTGWSSLVVLIAGELY
jgi:mannosyl-oligosaccharide glucosidase